MFNKGQGKTMGSYYTLLNALIEDGRIEEAEELFGMVFSRYMEGLPRTYFMRMISFYYSAGAYNKMFEVGTEICFFSYFTSLHVVLIKNWGLASTETLAGDNYPSIFMMSYS
jgi:pentatricopeptide repeat protein